ncbi:carboxylesterase/lipase family protein [Plantactinospora soyae]|uniref:Carboxylic ester hydrolase n=1 Tax=Plantactinospora soyae TaxID=1544732 RepID=A0A927M254_9ACTN|nr:carboxylesterase family protein [Plantactinospora soyae]MBE1485366.1 para-nitrobenzyl esterase [Plantactinospora soyae]
MTDRGPVRGTVAADHRSFEGIPYASAARFTSPRPVSAWTTVRDAATAGPACAQARGNEVGVPSLVEDCLNLNVFDPTGGGARLPVMVWIHGGSFKYGAGSMYDAGRLAAANHVVVVTINYRLGLLGSLAHPALDGPHGDVRSGDYGLQDQQAALRWVRANAHAFGGDPANVTLFGESAGGYSTCAQLASPSAAGLVQRAVIQSAPCGVSWAMSRQDGRALAAEVAEKLGCATAADVANCMRTVDLGPLLRVNEEYGFIPPVAGGRVLPIDPTEALRTGRFNRVPVMQGTNHDEYQLMVAGPEVITGHVMTADEYAPTIRAEFGAQADEVLAEYPLSRYPSAAQALAAVQTDHEYAYGAVVTNTMLSRYVPTYTYDFAERDTPWLTGLPKPSFTLGSYHLLDVAYLFTVDFITPLDETQQRVARDMSAYWTAFARNGAPSAAGLPKWSPFTRGGQYTQSLSSERIGRTNFQADHHYAFWAELAG